MNSPIIQPGDPMVQQVLAQDQREQQMFAFAKQIEGSIMVTVFSQLALEHEGEELTLEIGREMAQKAREISGKYSGFLLENLGLATMVKEEPKVDVMTQKDVNKMFDKS